MYHNRSFSSSSSLTAPTVTTDRTSLSTEEVFRTVVKADIGPPVSARSSPEQPSACTIQRHDTVYTASTTSLPASLIETPAAENPQYAPSIASQESSRSNRDRVLSLAAPADTNTSQPRTKVYRQPELHEVLPFAAGRPFSAWDLGPGQTPPRVRKPSLAGVGVERLQAEHAAVNLARRSSLPSRRPDKQERQAARVASIRAPTRPSKEPRQAAWNRPASGAFSKGKRTWLDGDGQAVAPCYHLGWERPVLDL